jgi:hypothetical protein
MKSDKGKMKISIKDTKQERSSQYKDLETYQKDTEQVKYQEEVRMTLHQQLE